MECLLNTVWIVSWTPQHPVEAHAHIRDTIFKPCKEDEMAASKGGDSC
jgi:hypothetical protein